MWFLVAIGAVSGVLALPSVSCRAIALGRRLAPARLRGRCRSEPSCSRYAQQIIAERGVVVGWCLAAYRCARCGRAPTAS